MLIYLLQFFLFSFLGWIIDSLYCSIGNQKWMSSGYFKGIPLCPIYGFGGILLLNNFVVLNSQSPYLIVTTTTILIILLEYFGGWFAENFLGEKLWDYSNEKFNLHGYISLWHSFLWLIVVTVIYFFLGEFSVRFVTHLQNSLKITADVDVFLTFIFLVIASLVTFKNKTNRLSAIKELDSLKKRIKI